MTINRREAMATAAAAGATLVAACGCGTTSDGASGKPVTTGPVDAGNLTDFSHDGVYDRFAASHEFFVVRDAGKVFALSAICTHRRCPLKRTADGIHCNCHGSNFTPEGHVTRGPARRDLPRFSVERIATGRLIVHTDRQMLTAAKFDDSGAFVIVD